MKIYHKFAAEFLIYEIDFEQNLLESIQDFGLIVYIVYYTHTLSI